MSETIYLKLKESARVRERRVLLGDLAELGCRDQETARRCRLLEVMDIPEGSRESYVISVVSLIGKIEKKWGQVQVESIGETDCVVSFCPLKKPRPLWEGAKAAFVCLVSFFGSAFAIMTFNNDGDVPRLFQEIYRQVLGYAPEGPGILELSYSIGLPLGILVFFNHFSRAALSKEPTPVEVQMRAYETDVNTTLVKEADREGRER